MIKIPLYEGRLEFVDQLEDFWSYVQQTQKADKDGCNLGEGSLKGEFGEIYLVAYIFIK